MTALPSGGRSEWEGGGEELRRYLLGVMSEAEESRVERLYLASDEALEEIRAVEDELAEDYLRGALESTERSAFERRFLASPARIERLVFLRALQDRIGAPGSSRVRRGRLLRLVARFASLLRRR